MAVLPFWQFCHFLHNLYIDKQQVDFVKKYIPVFCEQFHWLSVKYIIVSVSPKSRSFSFHTNYIALYFSCLSEILSIYFFVSVGAYFFKRLVKFFTVKGLYSNFFNAFFTFPIPLIINKKLKNDKCPKKK